MEYNDITYSMHTLLIKWGCTPSKESNIVLVWCNCSPYHTLDFFGPRTFEKLVPTPLVEFQGWGPTLLSFFKAVRHWKLQWQVLRLIPVFSCSFHPCLGWRFHVTFPRWVEACWSQKMVEGWFSSTHDLCQLKPISRCIHSRQIRWHLEVPAFGAFCNEIKWLRSPYCPKMMMIIQYLYWCFCFLVSQHIRGNARHFFKNWLA